MKYLLLCLTAVVLTGCASQKYELLRCNQSECDIMESFNTFEQCKKVGELIVALPDQLKEDNLFTCAQK